MSITLVEVGLRDGLQSEAVIIPTEIKRQWIDQLIAAGLRKIQVCSFVNPARVPQMADAEALCASLPNIEGVEFSGLVLNLKGAERAIATRLRALDLGVSASDTHSPKNMGKTTQAALDGMRQMVSLARKHDVYVRAAVQCAFGCVYEGIVPQTRVETLIADYLEMGVDEICLADSTGMANPAQMKRMLQAIMPMVGRLTFGLHLHDTRGMGLANVLAALDCGVTQFDTAFGGLGGCPFIKGATGNIATEDTAYMLQEMGLDPQMNIARVASVSRQAETLLKHGLAGKIYSLTPEDIR